MKRHVRILLLGAAFLTVPLTLRALTESIVQVTGNAMVGTHFASNTWQCLAVGYNNAFAVSGGASAACYGSAAVGYGLRVGTNYSLVTGIYNTAVFNAYLVVGNGSSDTSRSNALEVLSTGAVNIPGTANIGRVPERGGISMGLYTVP